MSSIEEVSVIESQQIDVLKQHPLRDNEEEWFFEGIF
jgi:hypothetical protein